MKKFYLFCSNGMSTSLLAQNMQDVADKHDLPIECKAFPHNKIRDIVAETNPDVILLGPQVKYLFEETNEWFGKDRPVTMIAQQDYGMMDGETVLKKAIKTLKDFKKN